MAEQRDIDRWKKGKDHWNKWAEGRLAAKKKLEKEGKWEVDVLGRGTNAETLRWVKTATVDFSEHEFEQDANFSEFQFPYSTHFDGATFSGYARFDGATFSGHAGFDGATFSGHAGFDGATFSGHAGFGQCQFDGNAVFDRTRFTKDASFRSARSDGPFSLAGATFRQVPDFIQMSFVAPARLDDLEVIQARPYQTKGDRERSARYRALKKIAIDSHDHVREQIFFVSEARERRDNDDPKWSPAWLFSFPYEFFSDFGRSIAAPFWWWYASTMAFWFIYLDQRDFTANLKCKIDPTWEALYLSLKSAFLVIGWERSQKLNQVYSCLYGGTTMEPTLPAVIPFLQMGQTLWSAILIFLFLLAVRNHFRIK